MSFDVVTLGCDGGRARGDVQNSEGPLRTLWFAGPGGRQVSLPGYMWPAGAALGGDGPTGGWYRIPVSDANRLCVLWGNPLGESARPFRQQAWGLQSQGRALAVAVEASTVSTTVAGIHRRRLVDLARIARDPALPGVTRAMLRLWRDLMAPHWRGSDAWNEPPLAAVSYQLPGTKGDGDLYRSDGWIRMGRCARKPSASGTWSGPSRVADIGDGRPVLWMWPYDEATRDHLKARRRRG